MNAAAMRFMTLHEGHTNADSAPKAASTSSAPVLAGKALTNDDVLTLKHAGLGDVLIIEKIRSSPGHYNLETSDLVVLKQAGISDPVISAMIQAVER